MKIIERDGRYFHLTPEIIARQNKLRGEAHDAAQRQATFNQIIKRLDGAEKGSFFLQREENYSSVSIYSTWLETRLLYLQQKLSPEGNQELEKDIVADASNIAHHLPYADTYGDNFIKKLKRESLLSVSEFLQFTREPWYPGLAGFYLLNKPEDIAYFRDLITVHLDQQPEDSTPVMSRAIEWLSAEIERMADPEASAFRKSIQPAMPSELERPANTAVSPTSTAIITAQSSATLPPPFTRTEFTWLETDKLAEAVGLTEDGLYNLGVQKKSAFTGFIEALVKWNLVENRRIPELHNIFGGHYQQVINTDRKSKTRTNFFDNTIRKLNILFPSLRPNPTNKARI